MRYRSLLAANPTILRDMIDHTADYTDTHPLTVFCGTWNVNGGQKVNSIVFRGKEHLTDWLLDMHTVKQRLGRDELPVTRSYFQWTSPPTLPNHRLTSFALESRRLLT